MYLRIKSINYSSLLSKYDFDRFDDCDARRITLVDMQKMFQWSGLSVRVIIEDKYDIFIVFMDALQTNQIKFEFPHCRRIRMKTFP